MNKLENSQVNENKHSSEVDLFNMKMLCIFEIIRWLRGNASLEQVIFLAGSKKIQAHEVSHIMDLLIKKHCIKKTENHYAALTDSIFSEENKTKMYKIFSDYRKLHIRRQH